MNPCTRSVARMSGAVLVLALAASPAAKASGWPVVDLAHINTSLKTQFDALAQYAKQIQGMAKDAAHYKAVYDHYQQELIKVQRMVSQLSYSGTQPLTAVDPNAGVEQRCNKKPSGLSLKSLVNKLVPDPNANIIEEQKAVCEAMVMTENARFNETVDFLTRVRQETEKELAELAKRRDASNSKGTVDNNDNDQLGSGLRLTAIHQDYSAKMQMFETALGSLTERQRALARQAMQGDNKPIGALIKTGTLEAALKVDN